MDDRKAALKGFPRKKEETLEVRKTGVPSQGAATH